MYVNDNWFLCMRLNIGLSRQKLVIKAVYCLKNRIKSLPLRQKNH